MSISWYIGHGVPITNRKSLNLYPVYVWTFLCSLCDAPWEVIKTLNIKNAHPLQIPHQYLIVIYIILHD